MRSCDIDSLPLRVLNIVCASYSRLWEVLVRLMMIKKSFVFILFLPLSDFQIVTIEPELAEGYSYIWFRIW